MKFYLLFKYIFDAKHLSQYSINFIISYLLRNFDGFAILIKKKGYIPLNDILFYISYFVVLLFICKLYKNNGLFV